MQKLLGIIGPGRERQAAHGRAAEQRAVRCASSCRPIASPASGPITAQEAKNIFEPGDIEAALNAASAIGDDRIQKQTQGYVVPDAFTHGSSAQRVRWFKRGYQTGDLNQCDTFNADEL